MLLRPYEMPWRPALEGYASIVWFLVAVVLAWGVGSAELVVNLGMPLVWFCLAMSARRGWQAWEVLKIRAALTGHQMAVISTPALARLWSRNGGVFMGVGFEWKPVHSQRLYELSKVDYRQFEVPWYLKQWLHPTGAAQPESEIGLPYIHGVEPRECALYRPLQNFEGGTLIVGTTQSGKGVVLGHLISQAVARGDTVIVIDPKNSHRLRRVVEKACADYRTAETFLEFHPAFPNRGVRLDFLFNWQKPTELASRIQSIMPADTASAFTAFGWDAVNVVVQAMVALEDRPNLIKLTQYIEGGIEPILEVSLRRFYEERLGPAWREMSTIKALLVNVQRGELKGPTDVTSPELLVMVSFYEKHVPLAQRSKVIDAQVRTFRHDREHYQKITANLLPILSMLTSGDLGCSLSPDPFDTQDLRPMMNMQKIERGGHVLYMNLDSLPDPSVATAIAGLALADVAARAGVRYNMKEKANISLFVDEVSNVINVPLIEILNKGAESGIMTTCAMQTLADLAKRLGSEHAARMAVGNLNNLIALRTKDQPTQDFIVETFGKTAIHNIKVSRSQGSDAHLGDFSAGYSTQVSESFEEMVPAHILGKLPNLQYFASVSGGRVLKGRVPIIDTELEAA
jgi:conjugal transfer pilus assembly protein TraD